MTGALTLTITDVCGKRKNCTKEEGKKFLKKADDYKFYLSFENSVCEDYMSKKYLHGRSYDRILPTHTYIKYGHVQKYR